MPLDAGTSSDRELTLPGLEVDGVGEELDSMTNKKSREDTSLSENGMVCEHLRIRV